MNITVLSENITGFNNRHSCQAEWGLSLLIKFNKTTILFDTGSSDLFIKNANNLKINLDDIDFVVLSHNHWDHTGGLRFLKLNKKRKLIIHPDIHSKVDKETKMSINKNFDVIFSTNSLEFSKNVYYLGEIPRKNNFEKGTYKDDCIKDDSAIVIKTNKGAVVISGCSHSGICNICDYAKHITKRKIFAVIGGFHMFNNNTNVTSKTIQYFKKEKICKIFPMHCVDISIQEKLKQTFKSGVLKYSSGDSFVV